MSGNVETNVRPNPDDVLVKIADYVLDKNIDSAEAYDTARNCLMDTLGCGLLALTFPDCKNLLGPYVEGTEVPGGVRVPGTNHVLDPVKGAWDIGAIIRWLGNGFLLELDNQVCISVALPLGVFQIEAWTP